MRAELLPALPAGGASKPVAGYLDQSYRISLRPAFARAGINSRHLHSSDDHMTIHRHPDRDFFKDAISVTEALRSPNPCCSGILAGLVTALALIPEVISFSFIAGVDPKVALIASVVLGLVMSVLGGRPAMVTAAAGSIALVVGPMVKLHGVGYILPTIILAGVIQIAFGVAGLARLMRFVPRSVMIGFVNALGILIFAAQVPHVLNVPWLVYPLFALSVAIILIMPRFTEAVPAPLVAIVVVTAIVMIGHLAVPNVGGEGSMAPGCPGSRRCWFRSTSNPRDHLADGAERRLRRAAGNAADRQAGRRPHRHPLEQGPGVLGARRCQHRRRLLRRRRRLRHDRPDGGQRENRPRPHPALDHRRRTVCCWCWSPASAA